MRTRTSFPPVGAGPKTKTSTRLSASSEWLNHATGSPASVNIFATKPPRKKRSALKTIAKGIGKGIALVGIGLFVAVRFVVRKMLPMRWRDWVTVSALLAVLVGMGVYMAHEKPSEAEILRQGCRWHTLEVGDTLLTLAHSTKIPVGDIATANGIFDVEDPPIGQQICIPSQSVVTQSAGAVPPASQTNGPVIEGEAAFVRFALPYARRAHDQTKWPVSVILAQWGLEQGWQAPNFTGYNFGNCGGLLNEPFISGTAAIGSPPTFAYADTPEDGLRFYVTVAKLGYYSAIAPAAKSGGPVAAAKALGASPWDAGHYTDHNDPGSSLIALMQQYHLQQYD